MDTFDAYMAVVVGNGDVFPKIRVRVGIFVIACVDAIAEVDVTSGDVNSLVADRDESVKVAVTRAVVSPVEVSNDVSVKDEVMVDGVDFMGYKCRLYFNGRCHWWRCRCSCYQ